MSIDVDGCLSRDFCAELFIAGKSIVEIDRKGNEIRLIGKNGKES